MTSTKGSTAHAGQDAVALNGAARESVGARAAARSALDVMLTDAAVDEGVVSHFIKPTAAVKVAAALTRRPRRMADRVGGLGQNLARAAAGRSDKQPPKGDRRFADAAWHENWLLRRILQGYLAAVEAVDGSIDDAELDWRTERQARFAAGNILDALAPSNFPWSNPAVLREIIDSFEHLNASYLRLREAGITPDICLDHGMTFSYYYKDPDGNYVELQCDIFGDWAKSSDWMRGSEEFHSNPMGTFVDPALVAQAAADGATLAEIHDRAKAKEFSPGEAPVDIPYAD